MIIRASAQWTVILSLAFPDGEIIDAGKAPAHQPFIVELPVLVTVTAKPVAAVVVPFIGKPDGNTVVTEGPELLAQPMVDFASPLAHQESVDRLPALEKFRAVPPAAVRRVGEGVVSGVARIPRFLG